MSIELLFKGLIIGFSIAMPVGPIGLLCIRNVLTFGMLCGLITGLGAACADAIYGALAGFGVATVSSFLETHGDYIQICGALFLCYLGISTFFGKASNTDNKEVGLTNSRAFLATFLLTLTNPMTIISFAGVYAGLGIGHENLSVNYSLITTLGVFLGSIVWWFILSLTASIFRDKFTTTSSIWLNKISGSILFGFGSLALIS